jgi:hypothetical protein
MQLVEPSRQGDLGRAPCSGYAQQRWPGRHADTLTALSGGQAEASRDTKAASRHLNGQPS